MSQTIAPHEILCPGSAQTLADILKDCHDNQTSVALNPKDLIGEDNGSLIDISGLNQVREYEPADLVITVETGLTIGELNETLSKNNQRFPLTYPDTTRLIDIISEDRPSVEAGIRGYPRDYILGLEIATPDGKLTQCGGKVMKNVTGYDLMRLYTGNHNTLGIVTAASFKLMAKPEVTQTLRYQFTTAANFFKHLPMLNFINAHQNQFSAISGIEILISHQQTSITISLSGLNNHVCDDSGEIKQLFETLDSNDCTPLAEDHTTTPSMNSQNNLSGLTVECITGLGHWQHFLADCVNNIDPMLQPQSYLVLPKAGLIWMQWPSENTVITPANLSALLPQWDNLCEKTGGFIQLTQIPQGFEPMAERFNLPSDETIRTLHKRLKASYDPNAILKSRRLPL